MTEQAPRHESLAETKLFQLIDGIGSIEAKLLTTAILTSNPDIAFTRATINRELVNRQGPIISWIPSDRCGYGYCKDSIEPIGAAVKGSAEGRKGPIDTFVATEFGIKYALPFTGVVLDWSIRYPDISVQKIFGAAATTGETRSPSTRFLIYQAMFTNTNEVSSYGDIANALNGYGFKPGVIKDQLESLDHLGVLRVDSKAKHYNPVAQILSPNYSHVALDFGSLQPETQLFYQTAEWLFNSGIREIDLVSFLAACESLDHDADLPKLRKHFLMGIQYSNYPNITLLDKGQLGVERTNVAFTEEYRQPLEELCNSIESVGAGIDLDIYNKRARQIINSSSNFSFLMGKSKRFSSAVRGHDTDEVPFQQKVKSVLSRLGSLTAREVAEQLEANGDTYDLQSVRVALNGLVKTRQAVVSKVAPDPTKRISLDIFSISE